MLHGRERRGRQRRRSSARPIHRQARSRPPPRVPRLDEIDEPRGAEAEGDEAADEGEEVVHFACCNTPAAGALGRAEAEDEGAAEATATAEEDAEGEAFASSAQSSIEGRPSGVVPRCTPKPCRQPMIVTGAMRMRTWTTQSKSSERVRIDMWVTLRWMGGRGVP